MTVYEVKSNIAILQMKTENNKKNVKWFIYKK